MMLAGNCPRNPLYALAAILIAGCQVEVTAPNSGPATAATLTQ
jgi:hypothetical protein